MHVKLIKPGSVQLRSRGNFTPGVLSELVRQATANPGAWLLIPKDQARKYWPYALRRRGLKTGKTPEGDLVVWYETGGKVTPVVKGKREST